MYVIERHLVNHQPLTGSGQYDATGVARVPLGTAPAGYFTEIERIVANAASGTQFTLFAAAVDADIHVRERAQVTIDPIMVFDENQVVRFFPNEQIIAVFRGGTPGDTVFVTGQAFTVVYVTVPLPDPSADPATAIASGVADTGAGMSVDQGGWN